MSSFFLAISDTYVLQGNSYWLSNVCSICWNAGFSMVLKGCISLAMYQTTLSVSAQHFALSCLYFVCRLNASVIVNSQEDGDGPYVALVGFFFPSWENCIGWLCFGCRCMFVVLPLLVATVLQQMRHTSSSRLSGSPQSFSLNPECSHTAACYFSKGSHAALCVMSAVGPRLNPKSDWQRGSREIHEENKQACKWKLARPAKLLSSF